MSLGAALKTEQGETLDATGDDLFFEFPEWGGVLRTTPGDFDLQPPFFLEPDSFPLWCVIDPYGDTMFNRLQMPALLEEIDRLEAFVDNSHRYAEHAHKIWGRLRDLAVRCRDGVHLYLWFEGD